MYNKSLINSIITSKKYFKNLTNRLLPSSWWVKLNLASETLTFDLKTSFSRFLCFSYSRALSSDVKSVQFWIPSVNLSRSQMLANFTRAILATYFLNSNLSLSINNSAIFLRKWIHIPLFTTINRNNLMKINSNFWRRRLMLYLFFRIFEKNYMIIEKCVHTNCLHLLYLLNQKTKLWTSKSKIWYRAEENGFNDSSAYFVAAPKSCLSDKK